MHPIKFAILLPVHSLARKTKTGDYFFAVGLQSALHRLGHKCSIFARIEQQHIDKDTVVIVLRGRGKLGQKPGRLTLMWCLSHPPREKWGDLELCDFFFVPSKKLHDIVLGQVGSERVEILPQCFDHEVMRCTGDEIGRGLVFVGSCRDQTKRPVVRLAADSGFKFSLWGNGWEKTEFRDYVKGGNVPNTELHQVYGQAGAVLNDHFPRMRRYRITSNRVYDALACGRPVLTDIGEDIPADIKEMIYIYDDPDSFMRCASSALGEDEVTRRSRLEFAEYMKAHHSFDQRAQQILAVTRTIE